MKGKLFLLFLLPLASLGAREGLVTQEMRITVQDLGEKLGHQKVELDLLHEKVQSLTAANELLRDELQHSSKSTQELSKDRLTSLEKRLASLEKTNELLVADLKLLKDHLSSSEISFRACDNKLTELDRQLSSDIKSLKGSIQSMVSLLQKGSETVASAGAAYTVRNGDSLGKIAMEHHTTIRKIKELNNLSSDTIAVGQKLKLPE